MGYINKGKVIDMKKKVALFAIIMIVLAVICGFIIALFGLNHQPDVGKFTLTEYQWEIENFPSDKNVGKVDDENTAIEKAKEMLSEKYGDTDGKKMNIEYDSESGCWHVYGSVSPKELGGVPHAIIQRDGKVVAVWYED